MYELIEVGSKTYYIDCPAKMGIYKINDTDICMIDSGNDKNAAKKALKIIEQKDWSLKTIINTHSHADHIGGNAFLKERTGCTIYAPMEDACFVTYPHLEPSMLYGGYPLKELRSKFLQAPPSVCLPLTEEVLPSGLEMQHIDGHTLSMVAIKTDDDIWFMADCVSSEAILEKYHISVLYDVGAHIESLNRVGELKAKLFIPSHAEPTEDMSHLVGLNLAKICEIVDTLKKICQNPRAFEDILKETFDRYGLTMDINQHVLVGSTLRSYLAYMHNTDMLDYSFKDNKMYWVVK